jgi:hypothetical protein
VHVTQLAAHLTEHGPSGFNQYIARHAASPFVEYRGIDDGIHRGQLTQ